MWRPDLLPWRRRPRALVRLAKAQVSLFMNEGALWTARAHSACPGASLKDTAALQQALEATMAQLPPSADVTVICDSRWLPVCMIRTGIRPLTAPQVHALTRHRFLEIYGVEAGGWTFETDYMPGDALALAFGLPHEVDAALAPLRQAMAADGRRLTTQPSLAWVWNEVWRRQPLPADGWLILSEQDRSIALARRGKRLAALQPAAPVLDTPTQACDLVDIEAGRFGLEGDRLPILGFSFTPAGEMRPGMDQSRLQWQVLAQTEVTA